MCQLYDSDMIAYLRVNNVRVRFVLCNYGPVHFTHALPASTFAIFDPAFDGLCIGMLQPGTQVQFGQNFPLWNSNGIAIQVLPGNVGLNF